MLTQNQQQPADTSCTCCASLEWLCACWMQDPVHTRVCAPKRSLACRALRLHIQQTQVLSPTPFIISCCFVGESVFETSCSQTEVLAMGSMMTLTCLKNSSSKWCTHFLCTVLGLARWPRSAHLRATCTGGGKQCQLIRLCRLCIWTHIVTLQLYMSRSPSKSYHMHHNRCMCARLCS